jgi:hypothetical protein
MLSVLLASLTACRLVDAVQDRVDQLSEDTVAQAMYIGVAPPTSDEIDLSMTEWQPGATATAFVFELSTMEDVPNLSLTLVSETNGSVGMAPAEDGSYNAEGLTYAAGDRIKVRVTAPDGEARAISVDAPESPILAVPSEHTPNTAFGVTLQQQVDAVLAVVFDSATGAVTYDNTPQDLQGLYDFTLETAPGAIEFPAAAFPTESVYAIGIAPLKRSTDEEVEGLNPIGSTFFAGELRFYPVSTLQLPPME